MTCWRARTLIRESTAHVLEHAACVTCSRCSAVITLDERLWTWGEHQPASAPALLHTSWVNRHGATDCGLHAAQIAFGGTCAACDATAADACCET